MVKNEKLEEVKVEKKPEVREDPIGHVEYDEKGRAFLVVDKDRDDSVPKRPEIKNPKPLITDKKKKEK